MSDEELALEPVLVNGEVVYVNRFGELWRWKQHRTWSTQKFRKIVTKPNSQGYIHPWISGTPVLIHRIISSAFLGLDMSETKIQVDHINGARHDNRFENLRLVNNQQNQFNQTKAKGYCWDKHKNKWKAKLSVNNRNIHVGHFDNPEDARQAYLDAKLVHHKIP